MCKNIYVNVKNKIHIITYLKDTTHFYLNISPLLLFVKIRICINIQSSFTLHLSNLFSSFVRHNLILSNYDVF